MNSEEEVPTAEPEFFETQFDHRPSKGELIEATAKILLAKMLKVPVSLVNRDIEIMKEHQDGEGQWHLRWRLKNPTKAA